MTNYQLDYCALKRREHEDSVIAIFFAGCALFIWVLAACYAN